jgi:hypothetical protein
MKRIIYHGRTKDNSRFTVVLGEMITARDEVLNMNEHSKHILTISLCSVNDQFSKKKGIEIALRRADAYIRALNACYVNVMKLNIVRTKGVALVVDKPIGFAKSSYFVVEDELTTDKVFQIFRTIESWSDNTIKEYLINSRGKGIMLMVKEDDNI